jgi:hypothetical protein
MAAPRQAGGSWTSIGLAGNGDDGHCAEKDIFAAWDSITRFLA